MYKKKKVVVDPKLKARVMAINNRIKMAGGKQRYPRVSYAVMDNITGSLAASTLLSHLMFFTGSSKLEGGWIYKTANEIEEELGLTQRVQERCRKDLVERGLIDEKRAGKNGQLNFRVNLKAVDEALDSLYSGKFSFSSDSTDCGNDREADSTIGGACFDNMGKPDSIKGVNEESRVWPIRTVQSGYENGTIVNNIVNTSTTRSNEQLSYEGDSQVAVDSFATNDDASSSFSASRSGSVDFWIGEDSEAELLYQAFCEVRGIRQGIPTAERLSEMQLLVDAGMTPHELPLLTGWIEDKWEAIAKKMGQPRKGTLTTGALVKHHDSWRAEYEKGLRRAEEQERKAQEASKRNEEAASATEETIKAGLTALDALDVTGKDERALLTICGNLYNKYFTTSSDINPFKSRSSLYMHLNEKRDELGKKETTP